MKPFDVWLAPHGSSIPAPWRSFRRKLVVASIAYKSETAEGPRPRKPPTPKASCLPEYWSIGRLAVLVASFVYPKLKSPCDLPCTTIVARRGVSFQQCWELYVVNLEASSRRASPRCDCAYIISSSCESRAFSASVSQSTTKLLL